MDTKIQHSERVSTFMSVLEQSGREMPEQKTEEIRKFTDYNKTQPTIDILRAIHPTNGNEKIIRMMMTFINLNYNSWLSIIK
jgi:hypothetical protein